jgi:hypothetical protein
MIACWWARAGERPHGGQQGARSSFGNALAAHELTSTRDIGRISGNGRPAGGSKRAVEQVSTPDPPRRIKN